MIEPLDSLILKIVTHPKYVDGSGNEQSSIIGKPGGGKRRAQSMSPEQFREHLLRNQLENKKRVYHKDRIPGQALNLKAPAPFAW